MELWQFVGYQSHCSMDFPFSMCISTCVSSNMIALYLHYNAIKRSVQIMEIMFKLLYVMLLATTIWTDSWPYLQLKYVLSHLHWLHQVIRKNGRFPNIVFYDKISQ